MSGKVLIAFVVGLLCCSCLVSGYTIKIQPNKEECFFDHAEVHDHVTIQFQVASGGFLDIDFKLTAPDGNVLHMLEREREGRVSYAASMSGTYTACFSNKMSAITPKLVSFSMTIGKDAEPSRLHLKVARQEHLKPIEEAILKIADSLKSVSQEQDYLRIRERAHRSIADTTNSRVLWFSALQAIVLFVTSFGQVYIIKRLLERRSRSQA